MRALSHFQCTDTTNQVHDISSDSMDSYLELNKEWYRIFCVTVILYKSNVTNQQSEPKDCFIVFANYGGMLFLGCFSNYLALDVRINVDTILY